VKKRAGISGNNLRRGIRTKPEVMTRALEEMGIDLDLPVADEDEMMVSWAMKADDVGPIAGRISKIKVEYDAEVRKEKRPASSSKVDTYSKMSEGYLKRKQPVLRPGEQLTRTVTHVLIHLSGT
jgi:hypothetical protein